MNLLRKSSMTLLGAVAAGLLAFACADADGIAADSSEINANAPVQRADSLVISAVYGGGGNGNSDESGDFVELFNPTKEAIDLAGYTLQTQPKGKKEYNKDRFSALKGNIEPGHYFLVGLSKDKTYGPKDAKKTPDLVLSGHDQDLIASAGSVAILKGEKLCASMQCDDSTDLVGYGAFDVDMNAIHLGESAPKATNKTEAVVRIKSGCVDSANNQADFESAPLAPRTSADKADCDEILAPAAEADAGTDAATPETDAAVNGDDAGETDAATEPTPPKDGGVDASKPPTPKDAGTGGDADEDEDEDQPKDLTPEPTGGKKKKSSANAPPQPIAASSPSCSTTSGPASSGGLAGLAGLGLALAALGRRRKN